MATTFTERQCGPDGWPVNAWRARCTCGWAGPVHRGTHPNQRLYWQEAVVDSSRHRQDEHEDKGF